MKTKKLVIFKTIKISLIVLFIIGVIVIGTYPVPSQSIRLSIETKTGRYNVDYSAVEIAGGLDNFTEENNEIIIPWKSGYGSDLVEMDVFRYFKSIALAKVYPTNFWQYGYYDDIGLHFYYEGWDKIAQWSKSFLLERIIVCEYLLAFFVLIWIIVNAVKEKIDPDNRDNHGPMYEIKVFFRNIAKYRQYMFFAAKADLNAEVANSYLNRLWWILEPFCNMLVYVIVFGRIMGSSIERYSTYVFSALIMWNYFSHIVNYSVKCVRNNRDIVTKIYVPKYILLLTNMVLNFIKLLFSAIVLVVMLVIFRVPLHWSMLWIIPSYILMLMISFSFGMILLHYGVFVDDLGYAVGILLSMLMFLSGVFYDAITSLAEPLNHIVLCLNPIVMFIDSMRTALLYDRIANITLIIVWFILSVLIGYIGIHIVNKNENSYVKVI